MSSRNWLFGLILIVATTLAYQPAWNGKPIWDDEIHITIPALRSVHGLARIWTDPAAAPQYYPLLHTVFWIEYRLWGAWPLPYHLVNIALHALTAVLMLRILQRLELPGAWVAAAIFALHPVLVESVAWISELKNTLSGALCAGSALMYLKYDQNRERSAYFIAFVLFLAGLMTKTVIVTLPAVLLVIFWWKRGTLAWTRDLKPLAPFFLVGLGAGLVTIWVEQKFCAEHGETFDFSLIDRLLIAGRLFWFYLIELFWPKDLMIIYPVWNISQSVWWQYLFPVLGFFNLSYFMSSLGPDRHAAIFRADHFQYLATIAVIAPFSAGARWIGARLPAGLRSAAYLAVGLLLLFLASMTWAQSGTYRDAETCFHSVVAKNPNSPTAHNNLGIALAEKGALNDAIAHYETALELAPSYEFGHYNLGVALLRKGEVDGAVAHYNLAVGLVHKGEPDAAIAELRIALQLDPAYPDAEPLLRDLLSRRKQP